LIGTISSQIRVHPNPRECRESPVATRRTRDFVVSRWRQVEFLKPSSYRENDKKSIEGSPCNRANMKQV
jgi:hypothetical protein